MSVVGPRYGATCLRPEAVKWEEALEPDDRDPRILGEGPCNLIHEAKAKYDQNAMGVWLVCRTKNGWWTICWYQMLDGSWRQSFWWYHDIFIHLLDVFH